MKTHFLFGLFLFGAIIVLLMASVSLGGEGGDSGGVGFLKFLLVLVVIAGVAFWASGKAVVVIYWHLWGISNEISKNEKAIEQLRMKIAGLKERAYFSENMDEEVKNTVEANILIWSDQIDIHRRIIHIYEKKRAKLGQHLGELRILCYLRHEVRKEPDAGKRLQRLTELNRKIDKSINFNIKKEIDRLLGEIRTEFRREKIVALQQRLSDIEEQIA